MVLNFREKSAVEDVTFIRPIRPRNCMETKFCPRHHDLTQRLMLGLLGDSESSAAEELLQKCPECASAYEDFLSGINFDEVQQGVSQGLANCEFSPRTKSRRWVRVSAMAAAATLLLAGGLHWAKLDRHNSPSIGTPVPKTIARIDFENPSSELQNGLKIYVSSPHTRPEKPSAQAGPKDKTQIFSNGAEDGNLKGWSLHT